MQDIVLTIDVGTGSARIGLVTSKGDIIAFSQFEYDQITPKPGWSEQAPSSWWDAVCQGVASLAHKHPELFQRIAVVSSCGQMHGTVLIDGQGKLASDRALLWNDKRNEKNVRSFEKKHDSKALFPIVNNPPTTAWPAFKLAWIQEHQPEIWEKTHMVLMPKDYINYMLCGVCATDYSEASCFYLMDSTSKDYSERMLNTFSVRRTQLPSIYSSFDIIGTVSAKASALTGLPKGIPVVAGTADMAATLLGSGVFETGIASDSTGTSTLLTVVSEKPLAGRYLNNLHLANEAWGGFSILDAGGDALRWARLAFRNNQIDYQTMVDLARKSPVGAGALFFLPYLTGERNAVKQNSRAQFFGLSRKHREGDLYRSIMEGTAYASAMNLAELKKQAGSINAVIASGGGAKDPLWLQMKASIYGLPVIKTKGQENGTHGCAIIGAVGAGLYDTVKDAVNTVVKFEREFKPDASHERYYRQAQEVFLKLYRHSQEIYDDLDHLEKISVEEVDYV